MAGVELASDETTSKVNTFTGFRVTARMTEGDNSRVAAGMGLPEQIDIMADASLAVKRNGVA